MTRLRTRGARVAALVAIVATATIAAALIAFAANDDDTREVGEAAPEELLLGIPQNGELLGDATAPVAVTVYADLLSPGYERLFDRTLVPLIDGPVRDGEMNVAFRTWNELGVQSAPAARAALSASLQDRYWHYLISLARTLPGRDQEYFRLDDALAEVAAPIPGLDMQRWRRQMTLGTWDDRFLTNARRARELGFRRPPGFHLRGPRGERRLAGEVPSPDRLEELAGEVR